MIGYVTTPPESGWVRRATIHLETDRHGERGELQLDTQMRAWHRVGEVRDGVLYTRCGRRIPHELVIPARGFPHSQWVIAVVDDPGDSACGRCEQRPAIDRRFRQALEEGMLVARALVLLMPEAERPSDDELRRRVTLELLKRLSA
jgi:hypothetical protein